MSMYERALGDGEWLEEEVIVGFSSMQGMLRDYIFSELYFLWITVRRFWFLTKRFYGSPHFLDSFLISE